MYDPAPPSGSLSLEERLAWMHQPVRLTPGHYPWLVRKLLEAALFSFFCNLEKVILALVALHRQGKLQPWPEQAADDDAPLPRISHAQATLNPAAPRCRAGATHGQRLVADSVEVSAEAGAAVGSAAEVVHADVVALPLALPRRAVPVLPVRPLVGGSISERGRCRSAMVCSAAAIRRENCA